MDHIKYAVEVYVTSGEMDTFACVRIASPSPLPAVDHGLSVLELFDALGKSDIQLPGDDWRYMTKSEVEEYREDNA